MTEILQFVIKYCSKLYEKYGFKFIHSEFSKSFGGNSLLILDSENVALKFIRDRDQLFLDFQSKYDKKKNNWYSLDIVRQLITDEPQYFSQLDDSNGVFLRNNMDKILNLFLPTNIEETSRRLGVLERKRAKKIFG